MLDAANWTTLLAELSRQSRVPGAVLGIWPTPGSPRPCTRRCSPRCSGLRM